MGMDGFFASMADARLEGRIDALERDVAALERNQAALRDFVWKLFDGRRPALDQLSRVGPMDIKMAQAIWDAVFGVPADGGGEGGI